ncbi:hypothetical protein M3610_25765 [Neobacillus sp. MER 74]|nr:hypothetical protein [Neobacillus sp. MER 74]
MELFFLMDTSVILAGVTIATILVAAVVIHTFEGAGSKKKKLKIFLFNLYIFT